MSDLVKHELGVHLNLRHADYLEDCGLGYGAMGLLARSPVEWHWQSPWNPLRPTEAPKKAYDRGTALHVAYLDGLKVYNRIYGVMPSKNSHPHAADTIRDLQAACERHRLSTSYAVKSELVSRLIRAKAPVDILEDLQARFRRSGKMPISEADDAAIRLSHRMAFAAGQGMVLPGGKKIKLADAFKGGLHEVSVFWVDEDGIRQRARFDKLKPNLSGDVKSITDWKKSDFKQSLLREIMIRGYINQPPHYDEARRQLRIAVAEGRVFGGTKTQRKRLTEIAKAEDWGWAFIFAKLDGAPQTRAIIIDREGPQYARAVQAREEALTMFLYYREQFGMENQWLDPDVIWEPAAEDWPSWSEAD